MNSTLHSVVDVITNSSTEIFTFANSKAIAQTWKALDKILKIAGITKGAKDLFKVSVDISYTYLDQETEGCEEISVHKTIESDTELEKVLGEINKYAYDEGLRDLTTSINVTGRLGGEVDLVDLIGSVFHQESINV